MRTNRPLLCLAATLFLGAVGHALRPADADDDPVRSMMVNLKHLEHVEMHVSIHSFTSSNKLVLEGKRRRAVVRQWGDRTQLYRRDADRFMVSEVGDHALNREKPLIFQSEWIFTNGELLHVSDRLDENFVQVPPTDRRSNLGLMITSPKIAGSEAARDINYLMGSGTLYDSAIVVGYLDSYPIADYFGDSARVTTNNEGKLVHVDSRSPLGRLQMWLDPAFGSLPRKFDLLKSGSDLTSRHRRVDEIDMNGNEDIWPDGGVKQLRDSADDIVLKRSGDVFYIAKITTVHEMITAAGPVVTSTGETEVNDVDFQPSFGEDAFLPRLKIPKGHPVTAEFAEQLPFEWDGEKVVAAAQGVDRFFPDWWRDRWKTRSILAVNIVLAALIVALLLYKRRRKVS